jgi:hypothetical protein
MVDLLLVLLVGSPSETDFRLVNVFFDDAFILLDLFSFEDPATRECFEIVFFLPTSLNESLAPLPFD